MVITLLCILPPKKDHFILYGPLALVNHHVSSQLIWKKFPDHLVLKATNNIILKAGEITAFYSKDYFGKIENREEYEDEIQQEDNEEEQNNSSDPDYIE